MGMRSVEFYIESQSGRIVFGLKFYSAVLKFLIFEQGTLHFHFGLDLADYIADLAV